MDRVVFGVSLVVGCAGESSPPELDRWLGADPHFEAVGTLDGEDLRVRAIDVACALEWEVPAGDPEPDYAAGAMTEIRISGLAGDRPFEFELKRHDFQRDELPAEVAIVPRQDDADPGPEETWVEWEWHGPDGESLYEQSAIRGDVTLTLLTGTTDETGLVMGDAEVGGFVSAQWTPTELVRVSFTAVCDDFTLEMIEP